MKSNLSSVNERQRLKAPAITPQALAWHGEHLWMGSRDVRRIYVIDRQRWTVLDELEAPGIPWAAVASNGSLYFTIGEDPDDDRYLYRYSAATGFEKLFACPDFTGSYLSFDGEHLYLSQWYNHRILQLDHTGETVRTIDVGAEICGHTFAGGSIYVLRGEERPTENWRLARLDPRADEPQVTDVASIGFACRSLTFDGASFWSNHREANEMVRFDVPQT